MMSVAEEERLNERLKAAGLWEDGLSLDEKQTLCNLLVESCTYALNEEEQRRQLQLNEEKKGTHSQNSEESRQDEQPQQAIQESAASAADVQEEIQEIRSSEEIIVASTSQPSQCKETVVTQKQVTNHAPSTNDLFQLTDDEESSGSLIPPSNDIDAPSSGSQKRSHCPTVSSIQHEESSVAGSKTLQSLPNNEDTKSGMRIRECTVELSQNLSDDMDSEASQSLLEQAKKDDEPEASFHYNLVLEQSKNATAGEQDLDEPQVQHQLESCPSTANINNDKPTDPLRLPSACSGSRDEKDEKSRVLMLDLSDRMPERRIIELHSKRIDNIRFNSPSEFTSADEETRVKIYKEILESLAKVSLALASSRRKPNVAMPWKKVIRLLPSKTAEDKSVSSCGSYSLRQRRGFKNRREIISDVFEEEMNELPEVEQIVKGKDDDWLPSPRAKKRRRGNVTGPQNVPSSEIAQIEYQSSDDEAFASLTAKRKVQRRPQKIPVVNGSVLPSLREDHSPSQHSVTAALPHLNIDKALLAPSGKKYGSVLQEKTKKHDSSIKMAYTQADREDSSSDVDVVEVDQPSSKFSTVMRTSLKSNLASSTTGSTQLPMNNSVPVLSGTSLTSLNNSTPLQRNELSVDSDKQRSSVVRNLLNSSAAFIRDKLRNSVSGGGGSSSEGGGAEERPASPQDEEVTVRPAPVKLRGEKRTLVAGSPSPAPKMPCKSKSGCPTSRCSRAQSPSAAQSRLPERNEGKSYPALDNLDDHHRLVLEFGERRRFLEESKRGGRGAKPKPTTDEGPASFQCPLCQVYFTRARIESHAAECDGVTSMSTRQQRRPQQDLQKPSCSSGPARSSKGQQVVHSVTTIDSEPEDHEGDRVPLSARAGLRGDNSSVATSLTASSAAVHTRGAGDARPASATAAKGNLNGKQQLLADSDDDDDLVSLDDAGKSTTKSMHNNGLKSNK